MRQVRNLINPKAAKSLYYSLFHSHLLYGIIVTSCATKGLINRITTLQKKAVRILCNETNLAHTEPLFNKLQILTFPNLILEAKLKFMHAITINYSHSSFDNVWQKNEQRERGYLLRNADEFQLPRVNHEQIRRMPLYTLPKEWNRLGDIRYHSNRETISIVLKSILLGDNPTDLHSLSVIV